MPGHSETVSLSLVIGNKTLPLSHVGRDTLRVRGECQAVTEEFGTLCITVGQRRREVRVRLPDGVRGAGEPVRYLELKQQPTE